MATEVSIITVPVDYRICTNDFIVVMYRLSRERILFSVRLMCLLIITPVESIYMLLLLCLGSLIRIEHTFHLWLKQFNRFSRFHDNKT